jgi:hypothetical protein
MEFLMLVQCFGLPTSVAILFALAACGGGGMESSLVSAPELSATSSVFTRQAESEVGSSGSNLFAGTAALNDSPSLGLTPLTSSDFDPDLLALQTTKMTASKPASRGTNDACVVKDFSLLPGRTDGIRVGFNFKSVSDAVAGSEVVSNCVKLSGVSSSVAIQMHRGSPISVNGGAFLAGLQTVKDGDEIRVRMKAFAQSDFRNAEWIQYNGNLHSGGFVVRTLNADRARQVFQVGPTRAYKQLTEIVELLRAGDLVEVDSGTYLPVEFTRSGSSAAPITIRGVGSTRPVIGGGKWGVSFKYANNVVFENFEITGAYEICLRLMADNVVVRNVFIHDCTRMGVLGSDNDNGSNTFDRVEITRTGGVYPGESYHHALYIATDRDAFPDAILRVEHSYLHNNKGNSIKSRAKRAEIYYNFIDAPNVQDAFYGIELIGYDGYEVDSPINGDIAGNVIVLRKAYGIRLGSDGRSSTKGRARLSNNTVVLSALFGEYWPVIRLDDEIDSVYLKNNAFVWESTATTPLRLFRAGVSKWTSGQVKVFGSNNALPSKVYMDTQAPLLGIKLNATSISEGQINSNQINSLNVTPTASSVLRSAGQLQSDTPVEYNIPDPLLSLNFVVPSAPPVEGSILKKIFSAKPYLGLGAPTQATP